MKHHREQHFQPVFGRVESLKSGRPALHLVCRGGKGTDGTSSQLERAWWSGNRPTPSLASNRKKR